MGAQGRVAAVTGASAGVGRATALELASRGFDVALLARGRAGLDAAAAEVRQRGRRALIVPTDVADAKAVSSAADQVEADLGPIDVWVNDAMTTVFAHVEDVDPEEFRRATEVTYLGQVYGTMAALDKMERRDSGTIVNVGSALAFVGIPLQAAYCGAKFACRGFFQTTRAELMAKGSHVRIAMVHLPGMNTPQFSWCLNKLPDHPQPVPPIYQPEVAARRIADSALDGRSRIVGSWNRLLVAAARLAPTVVAHYAAKTTVGGQQTSEPASPDRPVDLFQPVDDERDYGARGVFDDEAKGVLSPQFIKSLPANAKVLAESIGAALRDRVARRR